MNKNNKILIIRLIIAFLFWIAGIVLQFAVPYSFSIEMVYLSLFIVAYLISGYDILWGAIKHIISGELLDEYFLMSFATIGAFVIRVFGDIEYLEAVAVMIFFQIGEVFQGIAVEKSKNAIMNTMNLSVTKCTLLNGDVVDPYDVQIGDVIVIKPGEMVPIDGIAMTSGVINQASLTGEAIDIDVNENDVILSGSINTTAPLNIKTTKLYSDSTASKIIDMVENATMRKAKSERFITKFARIYTPIVVSFALLLALLPPTIIGLIDSFSGDLYSKYIYAALTCLVVSCPCALVVSVPLTYFAGIGANAKKKIIVKGGNYLEDLALCDTIIMDKTGTLTKAKFEVVEIIGDNKEEIIKIAKGLEKYSTHPLALAINEYEGDSYDFEIEETPGFGIVGIKDNDKYICGSLKLLKRFNIDVDSIDLAGSILYIAKNNEFVGAIRLEDTPKDEAKENISKLISMGKRVIVLSGDTKNSVESLCNKLGIKEYYYSLLPEDKVSKAEEIIKSKDTGKVLFVGDGINDAPVLALSDIGVSMGQIGSDSAIEASDVVILNDNLDALPNMLNISYKTRRIVIENIIFIITVKILILLLCAISNLPALEGFKMPMWVAIFGDVGVCVIAILNSMRALRVKK
jgi:Cd2+/Zn2+-exporting ATPase